jgi:hypothetical protein
MDNDQTTTPKLELAVITPKDLEHLNLLEQEIAGYETKYKDLTIVDENDKDGYEAVVLAIRVLRTKRTGLEAERKSVVAPYNNVVSYVNEKYKGITPKIEAVEKPLKEKKEAIDAIVDKKKEDAKLAEETKINNRVNELINNGAAFDGSYYSIKDDALGISETSIGVVDIRTMSDELFKQVLQTVMDKNERIVTEKKRIENEKKIEEEKKAEQEKKDRELFEQQKKQQQQQQQEFDKKQEEFKQQQEELKRQQDKLETDKKEAATRQLQQRGNQLQELGMSFDFTHNAYVLEDVNVDSATEICLFDDKQWSDLIKKITPVIAERKQAAEEKRLHQLELDRQRTLGNTRFTKLNEIEVTDVAAESLGTMEDDAWTALYDDRKKSFDKKKHDEEMEALSDADKAKSYLQALLAVPVPKIKTRKHNTTVQNMVKQITEVLNSLK